MVDKPVKQPVPIHVIVRDGSDPDLLHHNKSGDHGDGTFRDWITKTVWWALRNGHTVTFIPD